MKLPLVVSLIAFMAVGCVGVSPSSQEQYERAQAEFRVWLRGPLMETCSGLPGLESRRGCILAVREHLDLSYGVVLTREERFRVALAKAKGSDETYKLWTHTEIEEWLRGPKTMACQQAPSPIIIRGCLDGVDQDIDKLRQRDAIGVDPPEVRAEKAVARIEAEEKARAIESQRAHELDAARIKALGMFLGSGGFQGVQQPLQPMPPMQIYQPPPVRSPMNCTSTKAGNQVYTNCN